MSEPLTDLEIYQHAALEDVKQLILASGASTDKLVVALHIIDTAHNRYMTKLGDYVEDNVAPSGPGGIHHGTD